MTLSKRIYYSMIYISLSTFVCSTNLFGQSDSTFRNNGKLYGDVFLNSNYNIDKSTLSFRLNRVHLGYRYNFSPLLYFNGMFESALEDYEPMPDSLGGEYNHITNLFEFCLGFKYSYFEGKFGLIGTELNQQQEQLWKHRLIDKVFADKYGYAPTNDFGFLISYIPTDWIKTDVAITNGEGHKSLQADSSFRYAGGITLRLAESIVLRGYIDMVNFTNSVQTNTIGILGFDNKQLTIACEWNQQNNHDGNKGYHRNGLSVYGNLLFAGKYQVFARYDYVNSNKTNNLINNWNEAADGSLIIAGLQYSLVKGVNLALDYRMWNPGLEGDDTRSFLFFDVELFFND